MRLHVLVADPAAALRAVRDGATVVEVVAAGAGTAELVERWNGFATLDAIFVVRDDVEAAIALGADGVRLGTREPGAELAQARGLLLGLSAAGPEEAIACEERGAHYVVAGAVPLDTLGAICEAVSVPVVAAGGCDPASAVACLRAGAHGVAVTGAAGRLRELRAAVDAVACATFDATL